MNRREPLGRRCDLPTDRGNTPTPRRLALKRIGIATVTPLLACDPVKAQGSRTSSSATSAAPSPSTTSATSAPSAASSPSPAAQAAIGAPRPFSFALIGDTPYSAGDEQQLAQVLSEIDAGVAFILHVGDIKGGSERCSDDLLRRRQQILSSARQPVLLTPGDNEWTDCWRPEAGAFRAIERLDTLRRLFFAPERLPARPMLPSASAVTQQSSTDPVHAFPENLRWTVGAGPGAVVFVTINLPGSHNGRDSGAALTQHNPAREAANAHWLRQAFAHARAVSASGVVIAAHANPGFEADSGLFGSVRTPRRTPEDAYYDLRRLLAELATQWPGEVLFLHGDTHRFQSNQPLRDAAGAPVKNFTRVESYGWPVTSSWVRIDVSPGHTPLFGIVKRQATPG